MLKVNDEVIFGSFEYVSFPLLGVNHEIAKIDTGAYSGAVHCDHLEIKKRKLDGKKVLRLYQSDDKSRVVEIEDWQTIKVRSSTGHEVKRHLIQTTIEVNGREYSITIGLTDRSKMHCKILIGRRFLRENNILVNTRMNEELDKDSEERKV